MQEPQRCAGSRPQPLPAMSLRKQMQKIYCWKLFSLFVALKVNINRDSQAQSVKELARASSFQMWLFPFLPMPWSHRRLWAPVVCNTWWWTVQNIWELRRIHPWAKTTGIASQTACVTWIRMPRLHHHLVLLYHLAGWKSSHLVPSHHHRPKGKAFTKLGQGKQRNSAHFSAVPMQVCRSVPTEDFNYFSVVHPVPHKLPGR